MKTDFKYFKFRTFKVDGLHLCFSDVTAHVLHNYRKLKITMMIIVLYN